MHKFLGGFIRFLVVFLCVHTVYFGINLNFERLDYFGCDIDISEVYASKDNLTRKEIVQVFALLYNEKGAYDTRDVMESMGVMLPSSFVFSKKTWKDKWGSLEDILLKDEERGTYTLELIPDYMSIYLTEQGVRSLKENNLPSDLQFFSPYYTWKTLDIKSFDGLVTKGFVFELLSVYDIIQNSNATNLHTNLSRRRDVVHMLTEEVTGCEYIDNETDLTQTDFLGLSYIGALEYGKRRGYLSESYTVTSLNKFITGEELSYLITKVMNNSILYMNTSDFLLGFTQ